MLSLMFCEEVKENYKCIVNLVPNDVPYKAKYLPLKHQAKL